MRKQRMSTNEMPKSRGRDMFARSKRVLRLLSSFFRLFPYKIRRNIFNSLRYMRGKRGLALRYALLYTLVRSCGDNVAIFQDVYIMNPRHLSIGDNVSIHPFCYIDGGSSPEERHGVYIGDDVSIAHGCTIFPGNHRFDSPEIAIKEQGVEPGFVRIENNVWLGAKVSVLNNVTVATGCVLAAGAVVNKDTLPDGIYAGVPAKRVKERY
ncbi:MAG: acyltransferase [Clostridiaceae bacterium]|nr:acyltransferase [Clostridiaceae bacterium]